MSACLVEARTGRPCASCMRRYLSRGPQVGGSRYQTARASGMCGWCRHRPAGRGALCPGCYDKQAARNRKIPRKTGRRWICRNCDGRGHSAKTCHLGSTA